jgi:hypothetical protein
MYSQRAVSVVLCTVALLLSSPTFSATRIFVADFKQGDANHWTAGGAGAISAVALEQQPALQIGAASSATTRFSAKGYRQLVVTLDLAGTRLGAAGRCIAETSDDGGNHWIGVATLRDGEGEPGKPLRNGARIDGGSGAEQMQLRIRNTAAASDAHCWAGDVTVEATPLLSGEPSDPGTGTRVALTASALQRGSAGGPWPMAAFAPPAAAGTHGGVFEGRLQLLTEHYGSGFRLLGDPRGYGRAHHERARHLPPFDFEFIQTGSVLLPVRRGVVISNDPEWMYILEPGRVWSEAGDGEFQRASLPFALEERNENCMHNGVLTFLFRPDGAVSNVAYEIGKETCAYLHFDAWGYYAARYSPRTVTGRDAVLSAYQEEAAHHFPSKPMADLATDYPGTDPNRFGSPAEVPSDSMTLYGVVVDGKHYQSGCETRFGAYPYCDELSLPSYSLAKSLVGALSSFAMSRQYPDLLNSRISRYVPECTRTHHWDEVTFANALDMATGHFGSAHFEADENAPDRLTFHQLETHAARADFACNHYPYQATPGTIWVYHTTDTYLLGTALTAYYRSKQGPGTDLFTDFWIPSFWAPLHLSPAVAVPLRTRDEARQPFSAYGMTLEREDVVKLAEFINGAHGNLGKQPILDSKLLDQALQRDASHAGLPAAADLRYQHGFWAWNAQSALKCDVPVWIPFMSGYGGITVALMPNGMTYYYFSDGEAFSWSRAVVEADRIAPLCARAPPAGPAS